MRKIKILVKKITFKCDCFDGKVWIGSSSVLLPAASYSIESYTLLEHSLPQALLESTCLTSFSSPFVDFALSIRRTSVLYVTCKITCYLIIKFRLVYRIGEATLGRPKSAILRSAGRKTKSMKIKRPLDWEARIIWYFFTFQRLDKSIRKKKKQLSLMYCQHFGHSFCWKIENEKNEWILNFVSCLIFGKIWKQHNKL